MSEPRERDYVLGTHDEEIDRLGLQHRVWRPRALDAWTRAGFNQGQTLLDIGCGPGFATVDLAEIVGPSGRVIALDRSRRFLDALGLTLTRRGTSNVERHEQDLDDERFPDVQADGAWARWVFAFVTRPRDLLARVVRSLKPGGVLVLHEYCDYRTWRLLPRSAEHEEFVSLVMESWRASRRRAGHSTLPALLAPRAGPGHPRPAADRGRGAAFQLRLAVAARLHRGRAEALPRARPPERRPRP